VTQIRCYETTGRPVFITIVLHRRIPYLKNLVGQVAPQALPDAYETTFQKLALVPSWSTLDFVGWVEPTPDFVGFRCTQPNLHVASDISKYETQQRLISKSSPRNFFLDQTGRSQLAAVLISKHWRIS
jgi:hypothetical protein